MKIDMVTEYGDLPVTPAEYLMFLRLELLELKIDGVLTAVYGTYGSLTTDQKHFEKVERFKDAWLKEIKNSYDTMLREFMEIVKNAEGRKD
jgi:hypothetical protein